jgi:hypothetical protein
VIRVMSAAFRHVLKWVSSEMENLTQIGDQWVSSTCRLWEIAHFGTWQRLLKFAATM